MNRITITIDVPDGVVPNVEYTSAGSTSPASPRPAAASPPPAAAGHSSWMCPDHGSSKVVPAGVSKKTGKPYSAFIACPEQGCEQRPPRGTPVPIPPAEDFSELPF
jgi:hypothetical protein